MLATTTAVSVRSAIPTAYAKVYDMVSLKQGANPYDRIYGVVLIEAIMAMCNEKQNMAIENAEFITDEKFDSCFGKIPVHNSLEIASTAGISSLMLFGWTTEDIKYAAQKLKCKFTIEEIIGQLVAYFGKK